MYRLSKSIQIPTPQAFCLHVNTASRTSLACNFRRSMFPLLVVKRN